MNRNASLFLALFFLSFLRLFSQNTPIFYEHYTGLISDELRITADLTKMESSFSGYYYYQFKEGRAWISSKPIALDGYIDSNNAFVLNEFGDSQSFFKGFIENPKLIRGEWINVVLKDPVDFTLKSTYPKGSIVLNALEINETKNFQNKKENPTANYHLSILLPSSIIDDAVYHQLSKKIFYLLGYRGADKKQDLIIGSLKDKYFSQFENSLESIQLDSFPDQLAWEKSIRMNVINNEGGYLCLQFETYAKSGAREGSIVKKHLVFNVGNNKILKIDDFCSEEKRPFLEQVLNKKIREYYKIDESLTLTDVGFFNDSIPISQNIYLHPGGIGFYYNIYEIAPFSNGPTDLFLSWEELSRIIDPVF